MWAKLPGLFAILIAKPTLSSLPQLTENETEDDIVATLSSAEVRDTKSENLHRSCPDDEHSTESCQIPQMHSHLHRRDSAYSDESIMCHNVSPVCDEEYEQEEVIDCQLMGQHIQVLEISSTKLESMDRWYQSHFVLWFC
ncbi:hypothetical protein Pelo_16472 [Pelomyxa schiedti]|nr:hypothetical protein Pelo_16472 [Pelomyxa schiedti]